MWAHIRATYTEHIFYVSIYSMWAHIRATYTEHIFYASTYTEHIYRAHIWATYTEHILELPAKLLDYFLWSNKSNINQNNLYPLHEFNMDATISSYRIVLGGYIRLTIFSTWNLDYVIQCEISSMIYSIFHIQIRNNAYSQTYSRFHVPKCQTDYILNVKHRVCEIRNNVHCQSTEWEYCVTHV